MYTAERIKAPADQLGIGDKLAFLATYSRYYLSVSEPASSGHIVDLIHQELTGILEVCRIDAVDISKHDVSALIGHGFGLRGMTDLNPLESFVQNCPVRPTVIVEGADALSENKLRQLFVVCERLGLGLVLFGAKSLKQRKACSQFKNQILHTTVAKLSASDVRQLVRQRHKDHDAKEGIRLSDHQIDDLIERSHGEPGSLDGLVDDIVNTPANHLGVPLVHMSGLVLLMFVLVGGWWSVKEESTQTIALQMPLETPSTPQAQSTSSASPTPAEMGATTAAVDLEPSVSEGVPSTVVVPLDQQDPNAWVNNLPAPAAGLQEVEPKPVAQSPLTEETSSSDPSSVSNPTINTSFASQKTWLQSAPATAYTLQLMGSHDRSRVLGFIESQGSGDEFGYFETRHRNQPWFVLTVGQFRDRERALAAIPNLASELRAQKPWARSIASIRGE